jgi:MFS family permease
VNSLCVKIVDRLGEDKAPLVAAWYVGHNGRFYVERMHQLEWLLAHADRPATAAFFFWAGLLTAFSQLAAPHLSKRIGLLNTMVFTHIPASLCLIAAAFSNSRDVALGLLLLRALLSQMDVPARGAFVMAVVAPGERAAAASFTAVPRSLASAISPTLGGALFAAGWLAAPLVACGLLKIAYDVMLWRTFRGIKSR